MSFILDALKKSESERQRQNGPALFEVKIAPPRHRFAIWAAILGALLAINLGVVGWMLAQHTPARAGEAAETASAATAPASGPAAGPAAEPAAAARPQQKEAAASAPESPPPATPGATGASAAAGAPASAASTRGRRALPRSAAGTAAAALANGSPGAGAATPADSAAAAENPADLTPAVAAPQSAVPQGTSTQQGTSVQDSGGSVVRESNSGLPTYQELASQPGSQLPQLELDLHVYSPQPDQRFVFLNMTKLREGDSLPQGVRVDTITPSGVILSYRGKRFVLQR